MGTNGTDSLRRSLSELARDVPPPRDLWPSISAQLGRDGASAPPARSRLRPTGMQWAAMAAVVSALAVGIWLGRSVLPTQGVQPAVDVAANGTAPGAVPGNTGGQQVLAASFVKDPRYLKERESMIKSLEAQLSSLPPETQAKVAGSLKTIRASMKDIQAALGRDPANALLQELLVNTYQDEMRVLTAVHEASDTGRGI